MCRRILPRRLKRRLPRADATVGLEEDSTSERTSTAALIEACHAAALTPPAPGEPVGTIDAILDRVDAAGDGALWSVFLLDHGRLWAIAQRGYTMLPDGLPLDRGVMARALRDGRTQLVADVTADPDYVAGARGVVSELVVPVRAGGAIVGALNVETATPLSGEEAAALETLADSLGGPLAELRDSPALDLSSLARLFVHMSSLRDAGSIADLAARSLAHLLGLDAAAVIVGEVAAGGSVRARWSREGCAPPSSELVERLDGLVDTAAILDVVDVDSGGLGSLAGAAKTVVWLPLRVNGVEVGVLVGTASGTLSLPRRQAEAAALLAAQAASSIDAALSLVRERRAAVTDELTGLLNRRGFGDELERELERAAAGRRPLSLLVLDCDDFKAVNDRGGHERGDRVLAELGELIRATLGDGVLAGRLGGDEFAVVLTDTDSLVAPSRADALRIALARGLAEAGTTLHLSIGSATYPFDGPSATQLLRAADQALYAAKTGGKDLVVAFRDLAAWLRRGERPVGADRREPKLVGAVEASSFAQALAGEPSPERVLVALCRTLTSSLSATAAVVSRREGDRLNDIASYALRNVDLGNEASYLVHDFPLTEAVIEHREARTMSFVDDWVDRAEAFVLRELGMNSLVMLPLFVRGDVWGLIEVYDVRMRRFEEADVTAAQQLVTLAARRLEELADAGARLDEIGSAAPLQRPMRSGAESADGVPDVELQTGA